MTKGARSPERPFELGGHFAGVCGSHDPDFLRRALEGGATSFGADSVFGGPGETFQIGFARGSSQGGVRSSYRAQDEQIEVFVIGEVFNSESLAGLRHPQSVLGAASQNLAEVAVQLYRRYGTAFPEHMNGMFCIVMWDRRKKRLIIWADRFGSAVPLYYRVRTGGIEFASQLKLCIRGSDQITTLDTVAMAMFLKYSYVPSPRTIVDGVSKLGPGEMLILESGRVRTRRYTQFLAAPHRMENRDEAAEKYRELLLDSIRNKARGYRPERVGFFLSGGLDSSANVLLAHTVGLKGFKTLSVGFSDPDMDERVYATIVARTVGSTFVEYLFDGTEIEDLPGMVWHLDEPFMENGLFLTRSGFKAAAGLVDVIIAGDGADQLFGTGGFAGGRPLAARFLLDRLHLRTVLDRGRTCLPFALAHRDNWLFKMKVMMDRAVEFNDWFMWGFDDSALRRLCTFPIDEDALHCFSNRLGDSDDSFAQYYEYASIRQDLEHYVSQNVLVKSFRMAEMSGIRLREVYLDQAVTDFVLRLPIGLKCSGKVWKTLRGKRVAKYLHRLAMTDVFPSEILEKPKQGGFVPMTLLLQDTRRRRMICDYLVHDSPLKQHLDMKRFAGMLRDYEESLARPVYWQAHRECRANQIMNVLGLALWCEIVGGGKYAAPPRGGLSECIGSR